MREFLATCDLATVQPIDIQKGLVGTVAAGMAGDTIANLLKRARKKAHGGEGDAAADDGGASVEGLREYCEKLLCRDPSLSGDLSALTVLDFRAEDRYTCIIFTAPKFAEHVLRTPTLDITRLVGQVDYTYEITFQVFRKLRNAVWHKLFLPITLILSPSENHVRYSLLVTHGMQLLRSLAMQMGLTAVPNMVQAHADFTKAFQKVVPRVLPGARLVNDLEHFYRNIDRYRAGPCGRPKAYIKLLLHYGAYMPNPLMFTVYFERVFARMRNVWGASGFADYLRKVYFRGGNSVIGTTLAASWFCGCGGGMVRGHPATQNNVEAFFHVLKGAVEACEPHRDVAVLLADLGRLFRVWCDTPGERHSLCAPDQTQRGTPPDTYNDFSVDFIKGDGRDTAMCGHMKTLPTVQHIKDAWASDRQTIVTAGDVWVLHRWKTPARAVNRADAVALIGMYRARTKEELLGIWTSPAVEI